MALARSLAVWGEAWRAWVLHITQGPGAQLVFAGIVFLVLAAIFYAFRLRRGAHRVILAARRARKLLEEAGTATTLPARFEELDERLQTDVILGAAWKRFAATLLRPLEPSQPIQQAVPAEQFFDTSLLRRSGISPRFHAALPNILVGGGLLLTFVGLILALQAAAAVGSIDIKTSRDALEGLLRAISIKFYASLCGLGLSILYLLWHRHELHGMDLALGAFCDALAERIPRASPLGLAQESNRLLDRQLEAQQRLVNDLVLGLGDRLDQSLGQRLAEQIEPLRLAVEAMARNMATMNQGALETMIERFSSLLTATAGAQLHQLADTVATMSSRFDALANVFSGIEGSLLAAGQSAADHLATAMRGAIDDLTSRIAASASHLDTLMDRIQAINAALAAQIRASEAATSQLLPSATALERAATSAAGAAASLGDFISGLQQTREALEQASSAQFEAHERARDLARSLSETTGSFSVLDQHIRAAFSELQTSLVNVHERITNFAMTIDEKTAHAVSMLASAINDLEDTINDLHEVGVTVKSG